MERGQSAREETFKGWIFKVAFHEALLARRKSAVQTRGKEHLRSILSSRRTTPRDLLVEAETAERVREAMGALPAKQREVLGLRIFEDKSFATIAAELKVPLGTVLTRMRLAMHKLRLRLDAKD